MEKHDEPQRLKVTTYIDQELWQQFKEATKESGLTLTNAIQDALKNQLERLKQIANLRR